MHLKTTIELPQKLLNDFLALYCRYGMTPTCISSLLMYVILPAKKLHEKEAIFLNKGLHEEECIIPKINVRVQNSDIYTVFFGGNGQDCMDVEMWYDELPNNFIFWNYPGVKNNLSSHSPEELYKAGYRVVNELIKQGIPPQKIKLYGWSLGGNIATEVARRLYREEKFVHLLVDKSFSSIAAVVPEQINALIKSKEHQKLGIFASSLLSITALMVIIAGLPASIINTINLIVMNGLALLAYSIAYAIQSPGIIIQKLMSEMGYEKLGVFLATPFLEVSQHFNQMMNFFIQSMYDLNWWIVGVATVIAFIPMLIAGVFISLLFGAIMSLQLLWTDNPWILPMHTLCDLALKINSCNMNSVLAIQEMMLNENRGDIEITNAIGDKIIYPNASLCAGLGFFPHSQEEDELTGISCQWVEGDHCTSNYS